MLLKETGHPIAPAGMYNLLMLPPLLQALSSTVGCVHGMSGRLDCSGHHLGVIERGDPCFPVIPAAAAVQSTSQEHGVLSSSVEG